jgi:hypothetical protein
MFQDPDAGAAIHLWDEEGDRAYMAVGEFPQALDNRWFIEVGETVRVNGVDYGRGTITGRPENLIDHAATVAAKRLAVVDDFRPVERIPAVGTERCAVDDVVFLESHGPRMKRWKVSKDTKLGGEFQRFRGNLNGRPGSRRQRGCF